MPALKQTGRAYPGCVFRIPRDSGRALWQITNRCNCSCCYCIFASGTKAIAGELTTSQALSVLDQLPVAGYRYLKMTGGEPFVRPDLTDLIGHATSKGMVVDLSTNATLIREREARALAHCQLQMVHVSLDGATQETHEQVRGAGTFSKALRGIKLLVDHGLHVRLGCVIFNGNEHQLDAVIQLAIRVGAREIIFSKMETAGKLAGDQSLRLRLALPAIAKRLDELTTSYAPLITVGHTLSALMPSSHDRACPALTKFLFIDNLGRVFPCTWLAEQQAQFSNSGTLKSKSLVDLLHAPAAHDFLSKNSNRSTAKAIVCPLHQQAGA